MIGVSSGASTPEVLVEGLVAKLKERGAVSVDQFTVTEEDLVFHLPSNLARELDESGQAREFLARYGRATRTTNQAVSENSS
jgi:hypothetical protein